jgi:peptidoglycan/xylan/chitin deacetylase (PgdA/CDA1 family)
VPGTFFVIGENGVANRGLLRRMVADGDEIGNHSYTHPNMANSTPTGIKLELNATQRLIEAYTGSTRLFRAPYFGDAEPTTADELDPALIAQNQGYTIVGLHADPGDWMRRPADQVVQTDGHAVKPAMPTAPPMSSCFTMAGATVADRGRAAPDHPAVAGPGLSLRAGLHAGGLRATT